MYKTTASAAVLFVLLGTAAVFADSYDYDPTKNEPVVYDPLKEALKDVPTQPHPADFDASKQSALQERLDRLERIKEALLCIDKATGPEDIRACRQTEKIELAKIRLAYCNSGVSQMAADDGTAEKFPGQLTECQKAQGITPAAEPAKPAPDAP